MRHRGWACLAALGDARDEPTGTARITTFRHTTTAVLGPVLPGLLDSHPDIRVEVTVDDDLVDIVADCYDAGIRFGEKVDRDMIAVRVGPDLRAAVVAGHRLFLRGPAAKHVAAGRLVRMLAAWCPPGPGYSLYYPSRRQTPPALAVLVDALRAGAAGG